MTNLNVTQKRNKEFERNRDYANGTQDTTIYKQILNSLDPNNADGTLLNIDWAPVPIIPKFAKIVVNKILSSDPYPNLRRLTLCPEKREGCQEQDKEIRYRTSAPARKNEATGGGVTCRLTQVKFQRLSRRPRF